MEALHLLIKHTESRNPVSRRTGAQITISKAEAHAELAQLRAKIVSDLGAIDDLHVRAKTFGGYAVERSDCGSFRSGGNLGEFGPGAMQKGFEDGVLATEVVSSFSRSFSRGERTLNRVRCSPIRSARSFQPGRGLGDRGQRERVTPHLQDEVKSQRRADCAC